jgi:hypothetical protein
MSLTSVPEKVTRQLWGKAAGRCEYDGCNDRLWLDSLTQVEFNAAYVAHIVADSPDGPRGDAALSPKLKAELSNLMLLCDKHHRLVDREQIEQHPVERLTEMKRRHEDRIELVASLMPDKQSHVLLYGANIGEQSAPLSLSSAAEAMLPEWYPAESRPIEISLRNSFATDKTDMYWQVERAHLEGKISQQIRPRLAQGDIHHLSIFAIAPQPLLILLGALLSDIPAAVVYQRHREPPGWRWQDEADSTDYVIEDPVVASGPPALIFSLSATVVDDRVKKVIPNAEIWKISVANPNNDFLKSRHQASEFRRVMRQTMDRIKVRHGQNATVHVFPAMPVALAVELGRIRMPKADLPLSIYDEDRENGGFRYALSVGK